MYVWCYCGRDGFCKCGWCFFFQAEDGIRDYKVTGVQTCALPISPVASARSVASRLTSTNNRSIQMPKMKTKSSAKKRFRVRPGGTVKRGQAFKRHILTKKTTKNKRHLRGAVSVHETNMGSIAQMLPMAGL